MKGAAISWTIWQRKQLFGLLWLPHNMSKEDKVIWLNTIFVVAHNFSFNPFDVYFYHSFIRKKVAAHRCFLCSWLNVKKPYITVSKVQLEHLIWPLLFGLNSMVFSYRFFKWFIIMSTLLSLPVFVLWGLRQMKYFLMMTWQWQQRSFLQEALVTIDLLSTLNYFTQVLVN